MIYLDSVNDLLVNLHIGNKRPFLIAIDGRPCSGKSTLADQLIESLNAEAIFLDDFFIPPQSWPVDIKPAFPFPYFRNDEFILGIKTLAHGEIFEYRVFDWTTQRIEQKKIVDPKNIIIVEGVSVLSEQLYRNFQKKIFVVSDKDSEFEAISQRENRKNLETWKSLYLPSVDIYWQTKPWEHADILFAGRGINSAEEINQFLA